MLLPRACSARAVVFLTLSRADLSDLATCFCSLWVSSEVRSIRRWTVCLTPLSKSTTAVGPSEDRLGIYESR